MTYGKNYNMTSAHMSAEECDVLDALQGASVRLNGNNNIRHYGQFEEVLSDPRALKAILAHARRHYSEGGEVGTPSLSMDEVEAFRLRGRNGDNSIAVIGPRTRVLLDMMAGHKGTMNPYTGCPEYFSLGGMFNSIGNGLSSLGGHAWNGIKSLAQPAMHFMGQALPGIAHTAGNALGGMAGSFLGGPGGAALGSQLGGGLGDWAGNAGGQWLNQHADQMGGQNPNMNHYAQMAGQQAGQMPGMMQQGMGAGPALGAAVHGMGQQMGNSPVAQGMQGAGNSMMIGQNPMQAAQAGYHAAGGYAPAMNAAKQAYHNYMGGQNPQQAMMGGAAQHLMQPNYGG